MQKTFLLILFTGALPAISADKPAAPKAPTHTRAEAKARVYPELPEGVQRRHVTIWSNGTRMAADLYLPAVITEDTKLPVIIFANGTGGEKRKLPTRMGPTFVQGGYAFIAFDYRGWGESDSKLVMLEPMPEPDENEEVTVKARALRWQMDYADQTEDIRSVISFASGESSIDPERIGIFGTSFGGGLVTWVAAHDRRVKCLVAQVPGMANLSEAAINGAYDLAKKQARGETEAVPYKTNRPGGKMNKYNFVRYNRARWINYNPTHSADKITAPTLIIDAEADSLMDLSKNGKLVADILKKKGTIVKYHLIPEAPHYAVYRQNFKEVTDLQLAWFDEHLKVTK